MQGLKSLVLVRKTAITGGIDNDHYLALEIGEINHLLSLYGLEGKIVGSG